MPRLRLKDSSSIPIELAYMAIQKDLIGPLALFCHLKQINPGYYTRLNWPSIAMEMKFASTISIRKYHQSLLKLDWIGYHRENGIYRIVGWDDLRHKYRFKKRTSAKFEGRDFSLFKPFIYAAIIGYLVNQQKRAVVLRGLKDGRSNKRGTTHRYYGPISSGYLAAYLMTSPTTAQRHKQLAIKSGYIKRKRSKIQFREPIQYLNEIRKAFPNEAHHIRLDRGKKKIVQDLPDLLASTIRYGKRKKLHTI